LDGIDNANSENSRHLLGSGEQVGEYAGRTGKGFQETSCKWAGRLDHAGVAVWQVGDGLVGGEREAPAGVVGVQGDAIAAAIAADQNHETQDAWVKQWVGDPADLKAGDGGTWEHLDPDKIAEVPALAALAAQR
jgi:hypothetical protein